MKSLIPSLFPRKENKPSDNIDNKLLPGNKIISNKFVLLGICACISLIFFIIYNAAIQGLTHLTDALQGKDISHIYLKFDFARLGGAYLVFLLIIIPVNLFIYYKILYSFQNLNVGQKGKSRFLFFNEIKQIYKEVPDKDISFPGIGGLPVTRYEDKLYIDDRINNNFIFAITRGGKGEQYVIPSIDLYSRAEVQSSMVINDLKDGELSRAAIPSLLKRGYDVCIFDVTDYKHSNTFNLLSSATKYYLAGELALAEQTCHKIAFSLYEQSGAQMDRFWVEAPISLFTAVALAHIIDCTKENCVHKINMYSISIFISQLSKSKNPKQKETELDKFFLSRSMHDPARLQYSTIEFSEGKTRSSVLSIAFSKLHIFLHKNIVDITSTTDINIEDLGFGKRPMALFLRLPQNNSVYYPLISIFFSQIHFVLTNKATKENKGECARPVKLIADEIFNGAPIENLHGILATWLSAQISGDFYCQSYKQLETVYGNKSEIILDNCSTKIFIATDSTDTTKFFSDRLGTKTNKNVSRSGSRFSLNKTITESFEDRALLAPRELMDLKEGEVVTLQTLKRRTLLGKKIASLPVFAHDETALLYRYEYLQEFDPKQDIPYSELPIKPKDIDVNDIIYLPYHCDNTFTNSSNSFFETSPSSLLIKDCISSQKLEIIENILTGCGISLSYENLTQEALLKMLPDFLNSGNIQTSDYKILREIIERT